METAAAITAQAPRLLHIPQPGPDEPTGSKVGPRLKARPQLFDLTNKTL
jgi:hypothetical protein